MWVEPLTLFDTIRRSPSILVLICVLAFVIARTIRTVVSKSRLPPGPYGLPFLGFLPFVTWYGPFYVTLTQLARKYGNVYRIQLGSQKMVILNKAEVIDEAFRLDVFSGRDKESPMIKMARAAGEDQIVFNDGYQWKFNRKIALRALSIFSTSKSSRLEGCIHQNLDWLMDQIKKQKARPFNPKEYIVKASGAIISSIAFGVEPSPESPFFERLVELVELLNKNGSDMMLIEVFPPLSLFYRAKVKETDEIVRSFVNHIMAEVDSRVEDVDVQNVTDIFTGVEKAIRETSESEKRSVGLTAKEMRRMVVDMFDGGYFTINEMVCWSCLLLAQNQNAQERVAKEVNNVAGAEQYPSLALHMKDLHWTKAVFYETLRFATNLPLGVPHFTLDTVEFQGYIIPKGTQVLANFWAQNRNPETFPEPDSFKPERFISNDQFTKHLADKVGGFSVGKRRCIGEGLAIQELPIMIASIVQRFRISLDPETKGDPARDTVFTLTIQPAPHKLIFEERA